MMYILGIDPGINGAIAAIDPRGTLHAIHDMPTIVLPGEGHVRRRVTGRGLRDLLLECVPAGECGLCFLEDVQPWEGQGVSTAAAMVGTKMAIQSILDLFPHIEVRPVVARVWKRHFGLKKDATLKGSAQATEYKARSRSTALAYYPDADIRLAKHDGRAEALLIAHYGREVWRSESGLFDTPVIAKPRAKTARELREEQIDASIPFGA